MTDEQREKIVDLVLANIKKAARDYAAPLLKKLQDTGVDMTPEREELITDAFKSMMMSALAASMLMHAHPGMKPEELDKLLKEKAEEDKAEGELRWKRIRS